MNVDETYAELERVRRDIATIRHRLPLATPEWAEAARARLLKCEEDERELLQQLADKQGR